MSNTQVIELSGAGELFLSQDIIYHCLIFTIFRLEKAVQNNLKMDNWTYDQGDYDSLMQKVSEFD